MGNCLDKSQNVPNGGIVETWKSEVRLTRLGRIQEIFYVCYDSDDSDGRSVRNSGHGQAPEAGQFPTFTTFKLKVGLFPGLKVVPGGTVALYWEFRL